MSQRSKYCLVGIPDHQGVVNVGGRVGAALGPQAFRRSFFALRGKLQLAAGLEDRGDVHGIGGDVAVNLELASRAVRDAQASSKVTLVVGGGHDHGYSQLKGVLEALGGAGASPEPGAGAAGIKKRKPRAGAKPNAPFRLGCINIDAHLDVRMPQPLIVSGSPFYLAIESGVLEPSRLIEFGAQTHCNGPKLWEYVEERKVPVVTFAHTRGGRAVALFEQALERLNKTCDAIVVSLDLDAAAQSDAPGVSAPQPEGFTASEIIQMMELAGRTRKVVSLGVFELNPVHDIDDRTARLAAVAAWHFLAEIESRSRR